MSRVFLAILSVTLLTFSGIGLMPAVASSYPPCTITATDSSETINGTVGDDVICIFGGTDRIIGGGGNDIFIATGPVIATVLGGFGNDTFDLKLATSATVDADSGDDVVYGSPGKDTVKSGSGDDVIYGYGGDDTITDSEGSNSIYGGDGHDKITGGRNNDSIYGEAGSDSLRGEFGDDVLSGGDYIDSLYGGPGNDTLDGNSGNDVLGGGFGNDLLLGGEGDDVLTGEENNDIIQGGNGNDSLLGGYGFDALQGGAGSNNCDFDFGEPKDKFCVFPKKDPDLTVFIPQTVDVSDSEGVLGTQIRSLNFDGFKSIQIKCGAASLKVDFQNKKVINSQGSAKKVSLILPDPVPNVPFTNQSIYLYPRLYVAKNATGAEYQCTSSVTDFYGNVFTKNEGKLKVYSATVGQPGAPNKPKFEWTSPTSGLLSWAAPSFGGLPKFTKYQVQFSEDGVYWANFSNGSTKSTSFKVIGLATKISYSYRIRAINSTITGRSNPYMKLQWTNLHTQATSSKKISAPKKLAVGSVTSGTASISWASVNSAKKIINYKVSISTDGKTWLPTIRPISASARQGLTGLVGNTRYFVRVAAMSSKELGYFAYGAFTTK